MVHGVSLFDRHRRFTHWGALLGAALLLLFVGLDFELLQGNGYRELGLSGILHEGIDHVVVPILALTYPTYLATRWLIATALSSFRDAADRIAGSAGRERGFRVDGQGLPAEALPFVDAVNDMLARVDECGRLQEAFAADVAHELRTPLAIARLEIDRLDRSDLAPLREQLDAMSRLIDQLMIMAQLEARLTNRADCHDMKLDVIARQVVAQIAPFAVAEGRSIELDVKALAVCSGQTEVIQAALRNLIENAIRATPAGGKVAVIVGPGACIRVRDDGRGLEPAELVMLSQRYARSDHASTTGAGLGLAIVAKAMAMHGGSLHTDPEARELRLQFAG